SGGCAAGELETREAARDDATALDHGYDEAEGRRRLRKVRVTKRKVDGCRRGVGYRGEQRGKLGIDRLENRRRRKRGRRAHDRVGVEARAVAKLKPPSRRRFS